MHNLWLSDSEKGQTASSQTYPIQIEKKDWTKLWKQQAQQRVFTCCGKSLIELPITNLAKCLSSKPYGFINFIFRCLVNSLAFHGFSADSFRQQTPLNTECISTVCNVAILFGPSAPYSIAAVKHRILAAFEGRAHGRTRFYLSQ